MYNIFLIIPQYFCNIILKPELSISYKYEYCPLKGAIEFDRKVHVKDLRVSLLWW